MELWKEVTVKQHCLLTSPHRVLFNYKHLFGHCCGITTCTCVDGGGRSGYDRKTALQFAKHDFANKSICEYTLPDTLSLFIFKACLSAKTVPFTDQN